MRYMDLCNKYNIKPFIILKNAEINKKSIKDLKGKRGIYMWYNNITNDYYIGSSINLYNRLNNYYYKSRLNNNSKISRALIKYGHKNFTLIIIEILENNLNIIEKEQYYINLLNPIYNILTIAYSSKGFKFNHSDIAKKKISLNRKIQILSEENKLNISKKLKDRSLSEESKLKISKSLNNRKLSEEIKLKISKSRKDNRIKLIDLNNNIIKIYNNITEISIEYGFSNRTISKYINEGKLFKGKYYLIRY